MADTKGQDPKPNNGKPAETGSGAVKPPVLDLKPNPGATETKPGAPRPGEPKSADPKPAATRPADPKPAAAATGNGFAFGPMIAGAALGLAAAYGLAWFGLWPAPPAAPQPADPRLATLSRAVPELETVTQTTQSELAALNQRIAALENAPPAAAAAPADLGSIEADIAALGERIDAMAPAATGADPAALAEVRANLAAITTRLDEIGARLGTTEAELRSLDTTVTQTSATLAERPADLAAVLQLPLILSGFESAFATGRPFEAELAALRAADPDAQVPTAIANAATEGLPRPDDIARRFDAVLPDILAGRPGNPDAQWQDGALDWFRGAIALRPTGEMEGDSPEAIVSRLEGAIARRDFVTAKALLAELPAPMQAAAGDVAALVGTQAEAAQFLATLRDQALAGEAAQ